MAKTFPKGIFFQKPREGAPDFVRGNLSFKVDEAIAFLNEHKNAQGYVNIDMLKSEKGIYLALNEWKKPEGLTEAENEQIRALKAQEANKAEPSGDAIPW